jgi:hypothetical protein
MLDGETDVGYFDSFESAEDMAKYAEVFKKQRDVEAVQEKGLGNRNNWVRYLLLLNHGYMLTNRSVSRLERTQLRLELLSSRLLSSPRVRLYRLCSRPSSSLILVVCFVYFQCSLSVYRTFCSRDTCYATFVAPGFTYKSDTYTIHQ